MRHRTPFEELAATAARCPSSAAARGAYVGVEQVMDGRLYHGSRVQLTPGEVVRPGWRANHTQSPTDQVCVTSSLDLALYWAQLGGYGQVYVYEVVTQDLVQVCRATLDLPRRQVRLLEGRVPTARVVAVVATETPWQRTQSSEQLARGGRRCWLRRLLRRVTSRRVPHIYVV
ncbi:hypothetical protein [Pseudactinotalea terrae]|uniref:hypothetical protein n=1 Tax=Pseudactinotalea terrae TaxID=1743262 RepID=UPI0012E25ED8|nr:hypothetical protein [Pseudactinotalea terrae]